MSFHPPLRPDSKPSAPKEWYEEFIEQDELLLYITASLGVILPGLVYFIYHKVHKVYMNYALKKEAERCIEEAARCEVALLVLGVDGGPASGYCKRLESLLLPELAVPPKKWAAHSIKASQLTEFQGLLVLLVDTVSGSPSECSSWLLDWMEDVAADQKAKKKTHFTDIRFGIAGFDSSKSSQAQFNKTSRTLLKRLKILGSKLMLPIGLFDTETPESTLAAQFDAWCDSLCCAMDRNLPGGETASEEESTDDETDDETDETKKKTQ